MVRIDGNVCVNCGQCVQVCPALVFSKDKGKIEVKDESWCIGCAQCLAVCPSMAIDNSHCENVKAIPFHKEELPSPEALMRLIKARRSSRRFTGKPIPGNWLHMIVDAANAAPTAQNKRNLQFVLVTDKEIIRAISRSVVDIFYKVVKLLDNRCMMAMARRFMPEAAHAVPKFKEMYHQYYALHQDPVLHDADALLFIVSPVDSRFGACDANLAYQNASLMAETLGVAHFYTGFVLAALSQDKKKAILSHLGLKNVKIQAGMAMGMPALHYSRLLDRKIENLREL